MCTLASFPIFSVLGPRLVCIHVDVHVFIDLCYSVCLCVRICVYTCVCLCVCVYMHIQCIEYVAYMHV